MRYLVFIMAILAVGCKPTNNSRGHNMTQSEMESIVQTVGGQVQGNHGWVSFLYDGVPMALVSDPSHDRMRVMAPIKKLADVSADQKEAMMEANFHTALDARYATSNGVLYAVYIHPLSPLTETELRSALDQVANLVKTFGTTYAGGDLVFKASGIQN